MDGGRGEVPSSTLPFWLLSTCFIKFLSCLVLHFPPGKSVHGYHMHRYRNIDTHMCRQIHGDIKPHRQTNSSLPQANSSSLFTLNPFHQYKCPHDPACCPRPHRAHTLSIPSTSCNFLDTSQKAEPSPRPPKRSLMISSPAYREYALPRAGPSKEGIRTAYAGQ